MQFVVSFPYSVRGEPEPVLSLLKGTMNGLSPDASPDSAALHPGCANVFRPWRTNHPVRGEPTMQFVVSFPYFVRGEPHLLRSW